MTATDVFPELEHERAHLAMARASRDRMIERLEAVDPASAADEITSEYVEVTVWEALESLRSPGAGEFFGRIDTSDGPAAAPERWYIGRRHIEDDDHDPVVVDWRAPIAAPFYRATAADSLGVDLRRRFTLAEGELTAYLDEHLDDPDAADVAGGIPDPVLAEIGAARTGAMREIVATIQAEQDYVIRAPIDQVLVVQGGPGTGKTAVALHRAAYLMFEHRRRLARDGVLVIGPNRAFLDYIANVLPSLGERSVRQCTALDLCVPKVEITGLDDVETARRKGSAAMLAELAVATLAAVTPPAEDVVLPLGARRVTFTRDEVAEWLERAKGSVIPVNQRRERLRAIARQELLRRTGQDEDWSRAGRPAQGVEHGLADAAADPPCRPPAARPERQAAPLDGGRSAARRRGQLDPQRSPGGVRPRRRRRGPGPLGGGVAGHRPAQPGGVDDAGRRRRPVDDAGRSGALGRHLPLPRRRGERSGGDHGRRADDRLPRARADPHRRQPAAAAHRRRRLGQPQRAGRGPRPGLGARGAGGPGRPPSPPRPPGCTTATG